MKLKHLISFITVSFLFAANLSAQLRQETTVGRNDDSIRISIISDSSEFVPKVIKDRLAPSLFIPSDRLQGLTPWMSAPITRPEVHWIPVYGFSGYGFGRFTVDHFDKLFANLLVFNGLDVPYLIRLEQMMLGNTISLGKKRKLFLANGILYGTQYGVWGNMIGMGSREGLIIRPSGYVIITLWTQEYQSVYSFSPVLYPSGGQNGPYEKLPASPVVVSYGAQAYFLAGQFWIGIGVSLWHTAEKGH